jgi:hypothetical protein
MAIPLARRSLVRPLAVSIAALTLSTFSACGDGGGGGGGGGGSNLEVLDEATLLLNDGSPDPRTGQKVQFVLRDLSNPGVPLTEEDIEVLLDGEVDTESRVRVNPPDVEKSDIALVLDVSSSLTPADLEKVKSSAEKFVDEMLSLASTLRIYYFSSPSGTQLLGQYEATDDGLGSLAWVPDPSPDIAGIPGGDDSTALFHAVEKAIVEDEEKNDILVVFSDGKENSSPQGAREDALALIEDERIVVYSVGFGRVDRSDLEALSAPYGEFMGVRPSLDGLFDEVGRQIQSVYAVVYDTPASFGTHDLEMRIRADGKRLRHKAEIVAGVDLAAAAYGRYPTMPGSVVELSDLTQSPPATLTYTVLPIDQAKAGVDGLFAFAVEPTHACPGLDCVLAYQGPYGEGARSDTGAVYLPASLDPGTTWADPISGEELTFAGFETLELLRGSGDSLRYRCAKVTFAGGTHWFAPAVGLVRTDNAAGDTVLELASPPCLSSSFTGGCVTE